MTRQEAAEVFVKQVKYRKPTKAARVGDNWVIYSENMMNGGTHMDEIIENRLYLVEGDKVVPITPMDLPDNLNFVKI